MSRIAYVNGRYLPHAGAAVHIEDRGYQLSDGVYEVCEVVAGRIFEERRHMGRLARSLDQLRIAWPMTPASLGAVMREVIRRNRVRDGIIYIQVTRGVAPRDHPFPGANVRPALVVTARSLNSDAREKRAEQGIAVITLPDNRWERVDIKTISLLPNVLAKQKAREAGAFEAWFVDRDGYVTEGASSNAWIVTEAGSLVTPVADAGVLRGIARAGVMDIVPREGLAFEERRFTVAEAQSAREAFVTSTAALVTPVVQIDGKPVGDGKPGPVARQLRAKFHQNGEIAPDWAKGTPARHP